jgi:hypothetical protein
MDYEERTKASRSRSFKKLVSPPLLSVSGFYFGLADGAEVFGHVVESRSLAHAPQLVCRSDVEHPGLCHQFEVAFIFYAPLILDFRAAAPDLLALFSFCRVCVFITAVPIIKLFARGEGDSGGNVLRETTSRGLRGLVCPSRTSERGGEGDCVKEGG